ncbi:hypothetical protein [Gimesia aquarii]|uniref:hypothetical protein n=1 Tax=Gimesia aquarii TaxID=2527964 RepID=UPI0011A89D3A|nr:hypothetical protein [Gimesia aquarii]
MGAWNDGTDIHDDHRSHAEGLCWCALDATSDGYFSPHVSSAPWLRIVSHLERFDRISLLAPNDSDTSS